MELHMRTGLIVTENVESMIARLKQTISILVISSFGFRNAKFFLSFYSYLVATLTVIIDTRICTLIAISLVSETKHFSIYRYIHSSLFLKRSRKAQQQWLWRL